MGLDPVIEDIPINSGSIKEKIISFYESILNRIVQTRQFPGAVKPNYAFYGQYGLQGIEALLSVIELYRSHGLPLILDVKRGDVSKTAVAYSKECFEFFKADAVTLSPFLGYDSISPFIENFPGKGYYLLNKTSNKSSGDFQDLMTDNFPFYIKVSRKIVEWHKPGIGAVVGATYPEELRAISDIFIASNKEIPLLLPGVGLQGGDINSVMSILKSFPDIKLHRINSSTEINYAYKKYNRMTFADAAVEAIKRLNEEINSKL